VPEPRNVASLHALFDGAAGTWPDAIAVEAEGRSVSYRSLDRWSSAVARVLSSRGIEPGAVVGVATGRTAETAAAILGSLKAGAAYMPLDLDYPRDRLAFLLADARVPFVLTVGEPRVELGRTADVLRFGRDLPTEAEASPAGDPHWRMPRLAPDALAYVIYTSGSTGTPKGVAMPHRGPVNLVTWQRERDRPPPGGRTLHFSALSFDVACQELFYTWACGDTLVVVGDDVRADPRALAQAIASLGITRLFQIGRASCRERV